jgi:hypothetical protein
MQASLITANRTKDGRSVYLARDFSWSFDIRQAIWTLDTGERADLLGWARGQEAEVCDPYALQVELDPVSGPQPLTTRERIRAAGPAATRATLGYE